MKGKLEQMLARFQGLALVNDEAEKKMKIRKMCEYFSKNRQCKLPWTKTEIDGAIRALWNLVEKIQQN